jgi:hypothetical protein
VGAFINHYHYGSLLKSMRQHLHCVVEQKIAPSTSWYFSWHWWGVNVQFYDLKEYSCSVDNRVGVIPGAV